MLRPQLSDLPNTRAATVFRTATDADASQLAELLTAAFPAVSWDSHRVSEDLLGNREVMRTLVACEGGRLTGTASARRAPAFPEHGYVHWVAVLPEKRGQGLFETLMAGVLQHMAEAGFSSAILETDDERLPAISAYLAIGFVPHYQTADHLARWSRIFTSMAQHRRSRRTQ